MNQEVLEQALRCPTLPSLPAVAVRVLELTADVDVSVEDLSSAIETDQGLAARILKTVNSSYYGLRRPCGSINQALVILGLSTIKSLALGFSLVGTLAADAHDGFDYIAYWRRGIYTAVAAKAVARAGGVALEEEAFLAGLLQDMGMIALHRTLGDAYTRVLAQSGGDHRNLARCELAALEIQHPDVGAMLAERWRLPTSLVVPIRFHEFPTAAPQEYAPVVRCVALGNIVHDVLTDRNPAAAMRLFQELAAEWFQLAPDDTDDVLRKTAEGTRQMVPLFRLNAGPFADVDAVMTRAREQMEAIAEHEASAPAADTSLSSLLADSDQNDPLTGALANAAFTARAETAFQFARAGRHALGLVTVAIDGFERVTALAGPDTADLVLVESAATLEALAAPRGGVVARIEGAQFALLLPGAGRVESVRTASEIRSAIQARGRTLGLPLGAAGEVTVSVGIAAIDAGGQSQFSGFHQMMVAARRAAEAASLSGGNCVRAFTPKLAA